MRVLGGAGTGKTVAAMHRARWLAETIFQGDNDRIPFTTFTRNLAAGEPELPLSFYREEWERVVQPQEIDTVEQYMKASRLGRGVRLNRRSRREVWKVFEQYRALLNEHGLREREDALEHARHVLESASDFLPYRAVVVDEAQDMGPQAFRLLRRMVPEEQAENSLFIVGGAHQRRYS